MPKLHFRDLRIGFPRKSIIALASFSLAIATSLINVPSSQATDAPGALLSVVSDITPSAGMAESQGDQILVGADGSRYVVGAFTRTVQFNGGNITSSGANAGSEYIEKFTANNSVAWVLTFVADDTLHNNIIAGMSSEAALATDGSIDLVGTFRGQMNVTLYQPNGQSTSHAVLGDSRWTGFYGSFDGGSGAEKFLQTIGGSNGSEGTATGDVFMQSVAVDSAGNGYVGGAFNKANNSTPGSISLGNSAPQTYTTTGYQDAFIFSFDGSTGHMGWSASALGVGNEGAQVNSLAVNSARDQLDVAFQGGHQSLTVSGAATTSGHPFVSSNPTGGGHSVLAQFTTSTGNLNWAQQIVSNGSDTVMQKVVTISSGEIFCAGTASYTTTFSGNTHSDSYTVADSSSQTPYLVKYSAAGDEENLWGSDFNQGLYDYYSFPELGTWVNIPVGLAVDTSGAAYITFPFKNPGTFAGYTITPNTTYYKQIFVGKINSDFTQGWSDVITSSADPSFPESLFFDEGSHNLFISGSFKGTMGFGTSSIAVSGAGYQAFYGVIAESAPPAPPSLSADAGATITINGTAQVSGDTINVANGTTNVTVGVTTSESHATYNILGDNNLQTGNNTVTVTVTAQDGTTTVVSTFTVAVAASAPAPQNNNPVTIVHNIIQGLTAPVAGATPVTSISDAQFTGTVNWSGSPTTFDNSTVYTATVTLTPTQNFTLTGIGADFFTVASGTPTNSANSGIVSVVFPPTAAPTVVVHHDIPQKSSITSVLPTSIPSGSATSVLVSGNFVETVVGIRVNGVLLPSGSWKQTDSGLTITLPALAAGRASIQIFNGSVPVLSAPSIVVSAAPTPATISKPRAREIQCSKAGKGDRVIFAIDPVCPDGYVRKQRN